MVMMLVYYFGLGVAAFESVNLSSFTRWVGEGEDGNEKKTGMKWTHGGGWWMCLPFMLVVSGQLNEWILQRIRTTYQPSEWKAVPTVASEWLDTLEEHSLQKAPAREAAAAWSHPAWLCPSDTHLFTFIHLYLPSVSNTSHTLISWNSFLPDDRQTGAIKQARQWIKPIKGRLIQLHLITCMSLSLSLLLCVHQFHSLILRQDQPVLVSSPVVCVCFVHSPIANCQLGSHQLVHENRLDGMWWNSGDVAQGVACGRKYLPFVCLFASFLDSQSLGEVFGSCHSLTADQMASFCSKLVFLSK